MPTNKRRANVRSYPTIMIRAAFGSEADHMLRGHAEDQMRIFLPNHSDDVLHMIGGQALVNAKNDGIEWAFWEIVEPEELDVKFPTEREASRDRIESYERMTELVAAFDVVEVPEVASNNFGSWLFVTLKIGDDFWTFFGLGERNDGKVVRDVWEFYKSSPISFKDKPVVNHAVAMQAIIKRKRQIADWEDPPKEEMRRTDMLLDIAGGDADFAELLDEEFGDIDDDY
jgi:hypothetical protein